MCNFIRTRLCLALVILVVAGLLAACSSTNTTAQQPPAAQSPTTPTPTSTAPSKTPDRVDVVYFYRSNPCHCMQVVGDNIEYTVETYFGDRLASGKLTFKMLASDAPKNADMVREYNADLFQLFITEVRGKTEKTYPVDGIWGLTGDEAEFKEFVRDTIDKSLKGQM